MSEKAYILALDAGTTSCRSLLFDKNARLVALAQQEFAQHYPQPGWVEHDPEEIWQTQLATIRQVLRQLEALERISPEEALNRIACIGITNQRETGIAMRKSKVSAIGNALVWQDKRTAARCASLRQSDGTWMQERTGLIVDAYFSASKFEWMLQHRPAVRKAREEQDLCFGTVDTWLVAKLSGGSSFIMDESNASRSLLFDIHKGDWDDDLLACFGIQRHELPEVRPSSGALAMTSASLLGKAIPICGIAGDQQAALFGQRCFEAGQAKNTYGTGCFMLMNTGEEAVMSSHGLVTTIAWRIGQQRVYALEGSIMVAGAAVQWLRDGLGLFESAPESERLASSIDDNGGVYVVPAFAGLGAPYWDSEARGAIFGLTRGADKRYLSRAVLESMAYQTRDLIECMRLDMKGEVFSLKVDGGAASNDWLMQFQADMIQQAVLRPGMGEATALGAAFLAGLGVGFWTMKDLEALEMPSRKFEVLRQPDSADKLYEGWKRAVKACRAFSSSEL